jgi:hypothetical protein
MFDSMDLFDGVMKGFWGSLIEQVTALIVRLFCRRPNTPVAAVATHTPSPVETRLREALAGILPRLQSEDDWSRLQQALEQFGAQFDSSAQAQLDDLRKQVFDRVLQPTAAVSRLEQLTAAAFERAGITPQDVAAGERIAESLSESQGEDEPAAGDSPPGTQVADVALPWKWWTLSRAEIDRRTRHALAGRLRAARQACEQASQSLTELKPLKSLRILTERIDMVLLLLDGIPPLEIATPGLRLDAFATRTLFRHLDQAAQASANVTTGLNRLLAMPPDSLDWQATQQAVTRDLDTIAQHVRERRSLR